MQKIEAAAYKFLVSCKKLLKFKRNYSFTGKLYFKTVEKTNNAYLLLNLIYWPGWIFAGQIPHLTEAFSAGECLFLLLILLDWFIQMRVIICTTSL